MGPHTRNIAWTSAPPFPFWRHHFCQQQWLHPCITVEDTLRQRRRLQRLLMLESRMQSLHKLQEATLIVNKHNQPACDSSCAISAGRGRRGVGIACLSKSSHRLISNFILIVTLTAIPIHSIDSLSSKQVNKYTCTRRTAIHGLCIIASQQAFIYTCSQSLAQPHQASGVAFDSKAEGFVSILLFFSTPSSFFCFIIVNRISANIVLCNLGERRHTQVCRKRSLHQHLHTPTKTNRCLLLVRKGSLQIHWEMCKGKPHDRPHKVHLHMLR